MCIKYIYMYYMVKHSVLGVIHNMIDLNRTWFNCLEIS